MIKEKIAAVKKASPSLLDLSEKQIDTVLRALAEKIVHERESILKANQKDLSQIATDDPLYDRLLLNESRLLQISQEIQNVAHLPSPLGKVLEKHFLPNGLEVSRVKVPLGVVAVIYEARPNVTLDVFSLCFKAGNALILKGGSDAAFSNKILVQCIDEVLEKQGIDTKIVSLLPPERDSVLPLLEAVDFVDVIIPRGGKSLIDFVRHNAKVPVIETGAGVVHVYVDDPSDVDTARKIIWNAKTRRVSVCNALDTLILHKKKLSALLLLIEGFVKKGVELFVDAPSYHILQKHYPASLLHREQAYGREFLSLKMAIKTVESLEEAVEHIALYSSKHSEAIISQDKNHIEYFLKHVDAAAVYANASTAFTDGAQFGLGAEIGISTQKLHARGPMGLDELTSYKWIIRGNGQIRMP